jgi:hypothetical protein
LVQYCKSKPFIESFGGNIEEMHETVLRGLGGVQAGPHPGPGGTWMASHSFEALDKLAMFKLFSKRDLLLRVCSGMDIGILLRSADFLAAMFLKMRHQEAHAASVDTSCSQCLTVLFSSGCIMQLLRDHHGASSKFNFYFSYCFSKQRGVEIKSLIGSLFPSLEPSDFDHQAKKMIGGGVSLI